MIDYELKELFEIDSTHKNIIIKGSNGTTLTNADLYAEQFRLTESLCSEENLLFGCCESSYIEFTCNNSFSKLGKYVDVEVVLNNRSDKPFPIGRFYIVSDEIADDKHSRKITAFDALYKVLNTNYAKWYKQQTYPMTLKAFRNAFFSHIGITQTTTNLINDGLNVYKTIEAEQLSGRDILQAICEINGVFGHIGRDKKFKYIKLNASGSGLYPSETLYPNNELFPVEPNAEKVYRSKYATFKGEDYKVANIDVLTIQQEDGDIGVTIGDGTNAYTITGNFLCYGLRPTELVTVSNNVFNIIKEVSYTPIEVKAKGNLCRELGDEILIYTDSRIVSSYIINKTFEGIQSIFDTITSTGTEERGEQTNSIGNSIILLRGKSNVLERSIEETKSTITDVEAGLQSQITQNAGQITLEVKNRKDADNELSSAITQTADQIKAECVSKTGGSKAVNKFGWKLEATGFELYSNNQTVFKCNANGVYIEGDGTFSGTIKATAGVIGGCSIKNGKLEIAAANITSGTFSTARIPNLSASKITSGTISTARLSADVITTGNFQTQKITSDMIDAGVISADKITTGSFAASRVTAGTVNGHSVSWQRFEYMTGLNYNAIYKNGSTLSDVKSYEGQEPIGYLVTSVATDHLYSLCQTNA